MGGGGKKSKAPKAPDYAQVAQTEAVENRKTAEELTKWNRPTQVDQFGNKISWTQDGQGNWTQKQEASPLFKEAQSSALTGYNKAMRDVHGTLDQGGFKAPEFVDFDSTAGDKLAADTYEAVMGRARPEQEREQAALDVKLRQQGLQPGTEAYNRAMQNMLTSHGDVATQAGLTATKAGYDEARARYAQQLAAQNQEYAQALKNYQMPFDVAGSMANLYGSAPRAEFAGFSGATGYNPADLMGAAQAKYQSQMGGYNAGQNKKGSSMGMLGNLGSSAIGAFF